MVRTSMPAAARARMADSRPDPGPETRTSHGPARAVDREPCPRRSSPPPEAKGVPLRETEPQRARTLPAQRVAHLIGDGDDGVVERGLNVRYGERHVLRSRFLNFLVLPFLPESAFCCLVSPLGLRRRFLLAGNCASARGLCGCGHWCGYAGRAQATSAG